MSIQADCVIVGAGPVGLFQVFELGLLGIRAHLVDSLARPGGQCAELYPEKPIYDIPALPVCGAQELIDRLMEQIKPFDPTFHFGQTVETVEKKDDGRFKVVTSAGTEFDAATVVIAAGLGAFEPRRLRKPNIEGFEGSQVHYKVVRADDFAGQKLVICGGGDSALDWTLNLAQQGSHVTLIHRREEFRGQQHTLDQLRALQQDGKVDIRIGQIKEGLVDGERLRGLAVKTYSDDTVHEIDADQVLVFFGLKPSPGPIVEWGLELGPRKKIAVDTEKFQTSVPGIFAIGDVNTYPGKKELILSGFHEGALAAFGVQKHINPEARQFLQYTTTSPLMHERLGVDGTEGGAESED